MAKITKKGMIGSIGDLRYFIDADGQQVSLKGGPTRKRVLTDPNYAVLRKRMVDFGACASFEKEIRKSLRFYKHLFRRRFNSYLTGKLAIIIKNDPVNPRGSRTLDMKNAGTLLEGTELCARQLNEFVLQEFLLNVNESRSVISMEVPEFWPGNIINFPSKAIAFSLFMTVSVISKYEYHPVLKKHILLDSTQYESCFSASSGSIPKLWNFPESTLEVDLGFVPNDNQGLIICFGIEFYEPEGFKERLQLGSYAMKVLKTC